MAPAENLAEDPLRAQLLDAAARVFAAKGYSGAKIQDIVREAGLSTGAIYGRFSSKDQLLREAVLAQRNRFAGTALPEGMRVSELITRLAAISEAPLSDSEAVRLEAFVTARREADVAEAVAQAWGEWRAAVQPLVDKAVADGTVAEGVDPEAVLFFVRTIALGLLVQRGAGITGPDPAAWDALVRRIVASFGDGAAPESRQE